MGPVNYTDPDGKICDCDCHVDGTDIVHFFPCCDLCYKKFKNSDGTIDQLRLNELIKECYYPVKRKPRHPKKK